MWLAPYIRMVTNIHVLSSSLQSILIDKITDLSFKFTVQNKDHCGTQNISRKGNIA